MERGFRWLAIPTARQALGGTNLPGDFPVGPGFFFVPNGAKGFPYLPLKGGAPRRGAGKLSRRCPAKYSSSCRGDLLGQGSVFQTSILRGQ